ncbi:PAAR domain-containing protein [Pseudomonas fakonensis]|uniref:PAAR domain-containing protein n=1 Tax=Pseudomonas fakonensis TaxID=2842355 RepID=A0ABX8MZZ7_9PSED|nr:PAAR domain-containing protein [Pseudomonas fakonensis]QXH49671.1 PAAR domain-containing protein [Pseudomonas fakonensis]
MLATARLGDTHVCPIPGHGASPIVSASPDTQINALGAARVGDVCGCGAVITTGFPSVLVNHRPLAHLGSPTSHGGTIVSGSTDTFGGVQVGTAASQAIVDFAKLGTISPEGVVDEQLMTQLLADPQLEQRALLSGALVRPGALADSAAAKAPVGPQTPELIAVAGSQHDSGKANKMMFVAQAVRELKTFKAERPGATRTLVVFTPGYNANMLNAAQASAILYEAELIKVSNVQELVTYLNTGKDRSTSPIGHLSMFSHGVPQRIAFGYELPEDQQLSLGVDVYRSISPAAFSKSARVDSYACRTGMGNLPDLLIEEAVQFSPETDESLAQLLANHLRLKVRAYVRRSDYKDTWGSYVDRQRGALCGSTVRQPPPESWCKAWDEAVSERLDYAERLRFTYQVSGASNPVRSGTTPYGLPGGHIEFSPQ